MEQARALLFQINVPKSYWGETILTATHLINRLSSWVVLDYKSPVSLLYQFFPLLGLVISL